MRLASFCTVLLVLAACGADGEPEQPTRNALAESAIGLSLSEAD